MSGRAERSYVTVEWSPGRWGVMGSSQFGHIIQKYSVHINGGVFADLMVSKFHCSKTPSYQQTFAKRTDSWGVWRGLITVSKWRVQRFVSTECPLPPPSLRLQGWMGDCSGVLMMSPLGLVNSARLLEHQVKDNQVLKLQPGLAVLTLPQLRLRTSRAHSWVP